MVTQNTIIPKSRVVSLGGYKGATTNGVRILVIMNENCGLSHNKMVHRANRERCHTISSHSG